jgi:RNAse (barnase) inhibitor barstar
MSSSGNPFNFVTHPPALASAKDFLARIPPGIHDTRLLFRAYQEAARFPSYFGGNWDALLDCLQDFSWVDQRRIVIAHDDLPLVHQEDQARMLLDVLASAVKAWQKVAQRPALLFAEESPRYVEHELLVAFPVSSEATVRRILQSQDGTSP